MEKNKLLQRTGSTIVFVAIMFLSVSSHAMNKAELVDAIVSESGLSKADAGKALNAFVFNTTGALKKGDRISLVGFGTFRKVLYRSGDSESNIGVTTRSQI